MPGGALCVPAKESERTVESWSHGARVSEGIGMYVDTQNGEARWGWACPLCPTALLTERFGWMTSPELVKENNKDPVAHVPRNDSASSPHRQVLVSVHVCICVFVHARVSYFHAHLGNIWKKICQDNNVLYFTRWHVAILISMAPLQLSSSSCVSITLAIKMPDKAMS